MYNGLTQNSGTGPAGFNRFNTLLFGPSKPSARGGPSRGARLPWLACVDASGRDRYGDVVARGGLVGEHGAGGALELGVDPGVEAEGV